MRVKQYAWDHQDRTPKFTIILSIGFDYEQ